MFYAKDGKTLDVLVVDVTNELDTDVCELINLC